ncbi:MAG: GvpL/GvpF family gas vesicle protein [Candidatus Spechtbacterales bacterium]
MKYIYCVVNENKDRNLGRIGIKNEEVLFIPHKDIAVAVSAIETGSFDSLTKERITEYAAVHQRVQEALLNEYDVVPMAFGMIAQSEEDVIEILEKCYLQFKATLLGISGKVEFALQVFWDKERVLNEIFHANPDIQKWKGARLGKALYERAESKKIEYFKNVSAILKNALHDVRENKLTDEKMIANLSLLIGKSQESELDAKMAQLGATYEGQLRFKYIGPMPPYSFTSVNFKIGNFELIDRARKALELGEQSTFENIKRSYYAFAQKYHPDKQGGSQETAGEMKKIIQAYRTLEQYCKSFDALNGPCAGKNTPYSFRKKDVQSAMLV